MPRHIRRGFTLIELLIVVVIIGILAAVAIPKFSNTRVRAARSAGLADLHNLATGQEGFFFDSNRYAGLSDTGSGPGKLIFTPSTGHTNLNIVAVPSGWNATLDVPGGQRCGIFYGLASRPTGMPTSVQSGVPACW
jgi:type IV pilus assembly protein PilA